MNILDPIIKTLLNLKGDELFAQSFVVEDVEKDLEKSRERILLFVSDPDLK